MGTNLPWTARSLDALLQGATERVPVHSTDAKSGASFEKLIIDGRPCFLKVVSTEDDWIMRVTGNDVLGVPGLAGWSLPARTFRH